MSARFSRRATLATLAASAAAPALGQGFAGLGTTAEGFHLPDPDMRFDFPADHGPHPGFRIEWWYLTANMTGTDGTPYGLQWTLFRNALRPGLAADDPGQIWMAHAGITTPDAHYATERFARGGSDLAGCVASPFEARIDEWAMAGPSLSNISVNAQGPEAGYTLDLRADGPFVAQGIDGYSVKAASGMASHYYSQPFYTGGGRLLLPTGEVEVSAEGWLDREWSSQLLSPTQTGWDWISLHLGDGHKMMGFHLRDTAAAPYAAATWIAPDGTPTPYGDGVLRMEPLRRTRIDGAEIPTTWRVILPPQELDVTVAALNPRSWMDVSVSYWEGPLTVEGTHAGRGYLEMTGYA